MTRCPRHAFALAVPLLLACATTAAFAAWPHDPTVNVAVSTGGGFFRQNEVAVSDGAGGILLAWEDFRSGTSRIFAQRVLADGTIAPGWSASGNEVKSTLATRSLANPSICSDGAGGAVIAWKESFSVSDRDVYAQRMSASGAQLWGTGGVAVAASGYDQGQPYVVSDGAGSTLVVWQENHSSDGPPTGWDIYANRVGPNGSNRWGASGVIVCSATGDQTTPALVSDGAGGLDVAWVDARGPGVGIYAARRDSSGALHTGWNANGSPVYTNGTAVSPPVVVANSSGGLLMVWADDRNGAGTQDLFAESMLGTSFVLGFLGGTTICTAATAQSGYIACPDGADGAFVAWYDNHTGTNDAYAQHLASTASIANGWPSVSAGLTVFGGPASQSPSGIVSDGVGGCIISMEDNSTVRQDAYAAHLTSTGAIAEGWSSQVAVSTALGDQWTPVCVTDGAAGAILAWQDTRAGLSGYELYAQRVEKWGRLGNPEPAIASVKDVPGDQGGNVRVSWNASYLDAYPGYAVGSYWLWRQVPATAALSALRSGHAQLLSATADAASGGRWLRAIPSASQTTYWEFVASQIANGFPNYSLTATTLGDSTPGSNPRTLFMVEARGPGHQSWDSAPDSGYSVDNLPPPPPAPFAANYSAGTTHLHWSPALVPDLAGYRLYRGSMAGFVPDPAHRIGTPTDTTFADTPGGFYYYKVSAVDVHGNESATTLAFPVGTTDAPPSGPGMLALAGAAPNPLVADAAIRWSLSRDGAMRLAIVDLAGRRVRTLENGIETSGAHVTRWNAVDDAGRVVPSGLYFLVLDAEGQSLRSRIVVVH